MANSARPLVVRYGALGDMVMLTVLIRHLHRRFGEPVDIVASGSWTRPLLEDQPGVGTLYLTNSRNAPYWINRGQQQLVALLKARGASATWLGDLDNTKTGRLLQRAGWSPQQWCEWPGIPGPHLCDMLLRFAYRNPLSLGGGDVAVAATDAFGHLHISHKQRDGLDAWLGSRGLLGRPLILVQPGNKRTMRRGLRRRASNTKYWPEEHWASVLRSLRDRHPHHAILMLGVPQEAALNNDILRLARVADVHNVAHELPIARLMALSERALGAVSVDTGPAHLIAAVGGKVVTLFGKSNPDMYAPRGPGAHVRCLTAIHAGEQSMLGITPHQVMSAWEEMIPGDY